MWKRGPKSRRVNLVGILAALLALLSLGLPWWGIDVVEQSFKWGLATSPSTGGPARVFIVDQLNSAFSFYSPLMILLVLGTSVLASLGSFLKNRIILAIGLVLSIVTALVFLADVNNAVGQACTTFQQSVNCISGLSGSGPGPGSIISWGFESGYYLFLISTLILAVGLIIHRSTISLHLSREPID